jgi:hypothetical protein
MFLAEVIIDKTDSKHAAAVLVIIFIGVNKFGGIRRGQI